MLDYDHIKRNYWLIEVDLCRRKELDADTKTIQEIELIGQLKNLDLDYNDTDAAGNDQFMFILTILEKIKIKLFSTKCNSVINNGKVFRSES